MREHFGHDEMSDEMKEGADREVGPEGAEQEIRSFETKVEEVQSQFDEAGGMEGIDEALTNMTPEERQALQAQIDGVRTSIAAQERLQEYGGNGSIDVLWEVTKGSLGGKLFNEDDETLPGQAKIGNAVGMILGLSLLPTVGPVKGFQQIGRKVKLGIEKRKLERLEKRAG